MLLGQRWAGPPSPTRPIRSDYCLIVSTRPRDDATLSGVPRVPIFPAMHDDISALRHLVQRHADGPMTRTGVPGLSLHVTPAPTPPVSGVLDPTVCVVLQGAKEVTIGKHTLRYDPASYFLASVELAATGCICEASEAEPYVAVSLRLDREILADLLTEVPPMADGETTAFFVSAVASPILASVERLVALLDTPADTPVLAPLLLREFHYRLLQDDRSGLLRQIALADSRVSRVHRTIRHIREHCREPLDVGTLATLAGMSRASFYRHFRAATAMSPLQFHKTLRLQEARRLLLADADAQRAAYTVGYESVSQFSREYARLFGQPPLRDVTRLRAQELAPELDAGVAG